MDEENKEQQPRPDKSQLNAIEKFYENFRNIPLKFLDIFIGVCVAALVLVFILGYLDR